MAADEAIILAGGFGTRLQAVVRDVPKPLAPVAGRPFLAWLLDRLAQQGMRRCILATGYLAEVVEATLGARWQGMEMVYSVETEPLGTGGAIKRAASLLQGDAGVHVLNGDTWLAYEPAALEQVTRDNGCDIGIALAQVEDVARYGSVVVDAGRVQAFREKGPGGAGWINGGCYFLTHAALRELPQAKTFSFETAVLEPRVKDGSVAASLDTAQFIDIGVPEDYARAQTWFAAA